MNKNFNFILTDVTGIGDPFVLLYDDKYYMYVTGDPNGIRVYTSHEISKHWDNAGLCYLKNENSFGYKDFWAPEVRIRKDGKFVMHYTARRITDDSLRIGVAISDNPLGPFLDVTPLEPMFDVGWAAIDAHCFTDTNGKHYLYYVHDLSENVRDGIRFSEIYVSELNKDLTELITPPRIVLSPSQEWEMRQSKEWRWNEGPFIIKYKGKYYLTYSSNCYNCKYYAVGYAVASSPYGPFKKANENPILSFNEHMSGPGHNAFFMDKDGNLRNVFHIHTNPKNPSGDRRACFCNVRFVDSKLEFY